MYNNNNLHLVIAWSKYEWFHALVVSLCETNEQQQFICSFWLYANNIYLTRAQNSFEFRTHCDTVFYSIASRTLYVWTLSQTIRNQYWQIIYNTLLKRNWRSLFYLQPKMGKLIILKQIWQTSFLAIFLELYSFEWLRPGSKGNEVYAKWIDAKFIQPKYVVNDL